MKIWKHTETGKWLKASKRSTPIGYDVEFDLTDDINEATDVHWDETNRFRKIRAFYTPYEAKVTRLVEVIGEAK